MIKNNSIVIANADKNVGIVLIENHIYNSLCIEHLQDSYTYKNINFNPQFLLYKTCNDTLTNLNDNNHISDSLFNILSTNILYKKLPNFRILPKLHKKDKFGIRPLVNCSNSTTCILSKFLDFFLKPIASNHFTFLKDSQQLLQIYNNYHSSNKTNYIYSADFESLYTNIPLDEAISIISDFISKHNYREFTSFGFHKILQLVLKNNYFYYKNKDNIKFYLQITGVPMGTACSPSVANLYLAYFEIKYLHNIISCLYHRYIDDTFFIDNKQLNSEDFKKVYPNLTLNIEQAKTVNFLDLSISLNECNNIEFDLYVKFSDIHNYLLYNSNHPSFIFKNIPKSLLTRIRRNCTKLSSFSYHSSCLLNNLLSRGYPYKQLTTLIRIFSSIDRDKLINYKKEKPNKTLNSIYMVTYFDKNLTDFSTFLKNIWDKIIPQNSSLKPLLFKTFYKIQPNNGSFLVNNIKLPYSSFKYNICNNIECKICHLSNTDYNLFNNFNLPITIPSNTNCESKNCIYIITCIKCNKQYIGETGRSIKTRLKEHLYLITKNSNNSVNNNHKSKYLYNHFSNNHNILTDFKFQIFISNIKHYRNRLESDLIQLFDTIYPNGLNTYNNFLPQYLNTLDPYYSPPLCN